MNRYNYDDERTDIVWEFYKVVFGIVLIVLIVALIIIYKF